MAYCIFPDKFYYAPREDICKRKAFEMRYFCYNALDRSSTVSAISDVRKEISPRKVAKTSLSAANKTGPTTETLNTFKTNLKVIKKTKLDNYINFCSAENIYKINLEKKFKLKPATYKKGINSSIIRSKSSLCPLKVTTKGKERKVKSVLVEPSNS